MSRTVVLDPMYISAESLKGLPQLLSPTRKESYQTISNDIEVENWLSEVGLSMYVDVFLTNFGEHGSRLLSRKRLGLVRITDLPKMGITQFHHQKTLMEHIRHTLQFEFNSPIRKREVQKKMSAGNLTGDKIGKIGKLPDIPEYGGSAQDKKKQYADHGRRAGPVRRRSFDKNVWQSISKLRTSDATSLAAVEALREGNFEAAEKMDEKTARRRRRRSFDPEGAGSKNKADEYGNKVHSLGLMTQELHELQNRHLNKLKKLVKCEHAIILFLNETSRELLMVTEGGVWFRLAPGSGLAGYAVHHGEAVHSTTPYEDARFNTNLDEKTGWKTRNVICHPLRGMRGGGLVIGAIQCSNKEGAEDFDSSDQEHLALACQKIADELHVHYHDLLHIAEAMTGMSIFVPEKGGHSYFAKDGEGRSLTQTTAASRAASREFHQGVSEPVWR